METFLSRSPAQTRALAKKVGKLLGKGDIVGLVGELGAGKTVFVQGLAGGLGVKPAEYVRSPSFVLLNIYQGRLDLYHFDLYRLDNLTELENIGYKEYFYGQGVTAIEWAEKIVPALPAEYLRIELYHQSPEERIVKLIPKGKRYRELVNRI